MDINSCRKTNKDVWVVLGVESFQTTKISSSNISQVYKVKNIHIHADYQPHPKSLNDIALLEVMRRITFSSFIMPICLPQPTQRTIDKIGVALGNLNS